VDLTWIRALDGPGGAEPCCHPATVDHARRLLGDGPVRWAVSAGQSMTRHIIDQVPERGVGLVPFETLRRASEATVLICLCVLVGGQPAFYEVPPDGVEVVRDSVRRDIPLDRLLRSIRVGHAALHRALREAAPDAELPAAVVEGLFEQADVLASDVATVYVAERKRWETSQESVRWHLVEAIIAGQQDDPDAAERVLGYALNRHHIALLLWPGGSSDQDAGRLTADLLTASGGQEILRIAGHAGAVRAWIGGTARPGPVPWPEHLPPGWRAAAGPPSFGLAGFRRSHLGALRAARIAATQPASGLCDQQAVRTAALLTEDAERARWYVEETLGGLAADGNRQEQLRDTLRCYLASGRSLKIAARQLGVARNTVVYRVERAEELIGPHTGTLEIQLALEIMKYPGSLEDPPSGNRRIAASRCGACTSNPDWCPDQTGHADWCLRTKPDRPRTTHRCSHEPVERDHAACAVQRRGRHRRVGRHPDRDDGRFVHLGVPRPAAGVVLRRENLRDLARRPGGGPVLRERPGRPPAAPGGRVLRP
jgi:PucR C-terminal helix-turn-helix domain/GGDEF-like domain